MIANVLEEIHKLERQGIISYFPPNLTLPAIFPTSVNSLTLLLTKSCILNVAIVTTRMNVDVT